MNFESDIFKRTNINFEKLKKYGIKVIRGPKSMPEKLREKID